MKKYLKVMLLLTIVCVSLCGCSTNATQRNRIDTKNATETILAGQPTPTDIEYSLERYNLIRRAYWVNGLEEKSRAVECPVEKPLGYINLIVEGVGVYQSYIVDGKVSSLNSYLSPDSDYYETGSSTNHWLADVDGSYGSNDDGIFFFTPDGVYHEWTGLYHYSSQPVATGDDTINISGGSDNE